MSPSRLPAGKSTWPALSMLMSAIPSSASAFRPASPHCFTVVGPCGSPAWRPSPGGRHGRRRARLDEPFGVAQLDLGRNVVEVRGIARNDGSGLASVAVGSA
jgi:hypothetical protein